MTSLNFLTIELGELHSHIVSEVFEFVKKKVPPNVILQTVDGIFVAHKVILCAASESMKVKQDL